MLLLFEGLFLLNLYSGEFLEISDVFGIGNSDLFLEHFVEFGGTNELIRDYDLSILLYGYLFGFEDVVLLKILLAKDSIGLLLVEE